MFRPCCSSAAAASMLASQDLLLTYIKSQRPLPAVAPGLGLERRTSSGVVDARSWEVSFDELEIHQPIGEGSFGRVSWLLLTVALGCMLPLPFLDACRSLAAHAAGRKTGPGG